VVVERREGGKEGEREGGSKVGRKRGGKRGREELREGWMEEGRQEGGSNRGRETLKAITRALTKRGENRISAASAYSTSLTPRRCHSLSAPLSHHHVSIEMTYNNMKLKRQRRNAEHVAKNACLCVKNKKQCARTNFAVCGFSHPAFALVAGCESTAGKRSKNANNLICSARKNLRNFSFWCFCALQDEYKTLGKQPTLSPPNKYP